jgi:iron uptake system EfeUOB component EfeO/EfeM
MTDSELNQHIDSNLDRMNYFNIDFYHRCWDFILPGLYMKLNTGVRRKIEGNMDTLSEELCHS